MNNVEIRDMISHIMATARTEADISQRDMARMLNKSISSIQNWESGLSVPQVTTVIEWFDICQTNILNAIHRYKHPDANTDKGTRKAVVEYFQSIASDSQIERLAFCIFGDTGSDWSAQVDMLTCINHISMLTRINVAELILNTYLIGQAQNTLLFDDKAAPDTVNFKNAIDKAKESAYKGLNKYSPM